MDSLFQVFGNVAQGVVFNQVFQSILVFGKFPKLSIILWRQVFADKFYTIICSIIMVVIFSLLTVTKKYIWYSSHSVEKIEGKFHWYYIQSDIVSMLRSSTTQLSVVIGLIVD